MTRENLSNVIPIGEMIKTGINDSDPFNPYIACHKQKYDLSYLSPLGEKTSRRIAEAISLRLAALKRPKSGCRHQASMHIRVFFEWLCSEMGKPDTPPYFARIQESFAQNKMPDIKDWQSAVSGFRACLLSKTGEFARLSKRSKDSRLESLRPLINFLADKGIAPRAVVAGIKNARKSSRPIKALGEVVNSKVTEEEIGRYLGGILDKDGLGHSITSQEKIDCYRALASGGIEVSGTPEEMISKLVAYNETLLDKVRYCAETYFISCWEHYQEGQRLIEGCDLSFENDLKPAFDEYWSEVQHPTMPIAHMANLAFTKFFRHVPKEVILSRILTFLDGQFGFCPVPTQKGIYPPFIKKALPRIYDGRHPLTEIDRYLNGDDLALHCAQLIIMIDTSFNTSVVHEMPVDCVRDTDIADIKTLWGWKDRAAGSIQDANVRVNDGNRISALQVVGAVKAMTRRARDLALNGHEPYRIHKDHPRVADYLFCRRIAADRKNPEIAELIDENSVRISGMYKGSHSRHKGFKDMHADLQGYDFAPSSIRPSVLIRKFMSGDLDIDLARAEANHRYMSTNSGYTMRAVSKAALEQEMRKFQNLFEAIVIENIPDAAEKLGFTPEEYEENLKTAMRSGLGTVCHHLQKREDGEIVSVKKGDCNSDDCVDGCPLAHLVPGSLENLVDLILHKNYLTSHEEELRSSNSLRWEKVHMKWLALCEAAIDRAKSSSVVSRKILNEAIEKANELGEQAFLPAE